VNDCHGGGRGDATRHQPEKSPSNTVGATFMVARRGPPEGDGLRLSPSLQSRIVLLLICPPCVILSEAKDLVRIHIQGDRPTRVATPPRAATRVRPYYATYRPARPVHRRGDGLSSPWVGAVALGGVANAGIMSCSAPNFPYAIMDGHERLSNRTCPSVIACFCEASFYSVVRMWKSGLNSLTWRTLWLLRLIRH